MGQDERRCVIRWVIAPPALPAVVRPLTSHGPKHVSPKNEGPEAVHGTMGVFLVRTFGTTFLAEHGFESLCVESPPVQLLSPFAQRILEALLGSSTISVQRYGKAR